MAIIVIVRYVPKINQPNVKAHHRDSGELSLLYMSPLAMFYCGCKLRMRTMCLSQQSRDTLQFCCCFTVNCDPCWWARRLMFKKDTRGRWNGNSQNPHVICINYYVVVFWIYILHWYLFSSIFSAYNNPVVAVDSSFGYSLSPSFVVQEFVKHYLSMVRI